jgi:hypothetical protein
VAHTSNSCYSGGREQEDSGSKPAQANSLQDPVSTTTKITFYFLFFVGGFLKILPSNYCEYLALW